jgi:hypothetical protein
MVAAASAPRPRLARAPRDVDPAWSAGRSLRPRERVRRVNRRRVLRRAAELRRLLLLLRF